jgi:hypothetical protein
VHHIFAALAPAIKKSVVGVEDLPETCIKFAVIPHEAMHEICTKVAVFQH